jgi:hypothetical protein
MANRLLADHIELAGSGEAGVAAGPGHIETAGAEQSTVAADSEIVTLPERRIEEIAAAMIAAAIHKQIPPAAKIHSITLGGDLDHILVDIRTTRPGTAPGSAEIGRLRDELEELTGKPVLLNTLEDRPHPEERR